MLLLGNRAGGAGAFYSAVDAHAGRQVAQGEVDMPVSQVWAASSRSLMTDKDGGCAVHFESFLGLGRDLGHAPTPQLDACCWVDAACHRQEDRCRAQHA